jgi:hypothetical protein
MAFLTINKEEEGKITATKSKMTEKMKVLKEKCTSGKFEDLARYHVLSRI